MEDITEELYTEAEGWAAIAVIAGIKWNIASWDWKKVRDSGVKCEQNSQPYKFPRIFSTTISILHYCSFPPASSMT